MKFIASSGALLRQLQIISAVISSKVVIPILEYFLFEIDKGKLRIVGTDLEVSIQGTLDIESDENGKIAVPAKLILEILKSLPEQPITFTINEKNKSIELTSDNGKYKITGEIAEDFPKFPTIEDASSFEVPAEILINAINKTLFAISNDELKPALTGLYMELDEEHLCFVTTDGNKLVKYQRNDIKSNDTTSFIIPKKTLNVIKSSISGDNASMGVEVKYNKINALFSLGNITIVCRLIDEKFPDFNSAIPVNLPNKLRVNRIEFLDCLKRIYIFSNKSSNQINFKIAGNELQVSTQALDFANEASERLSCEFEGEDMEIGFNARYLIEMSSCMDSDEVVVSLLAPSRPGTITPNESNENESLVMLLMPIVVKISEE
jgi:DNA polymerase III subunit beta